MPGRSEKPRRVRVERDGPMLVEGPVEVTTPDGEVVVSDRFVVAICTCRRSRTYPWCDTSHRRREPAPGSAAEDAADRPAGARSGEAGKTTAHGTDGTGGTDSTDDTDGMDVATVKDSGS
ncbi:CDGSH iron-sulfur domain-containing protein [Streptomyces sp. NPDC091267]|uniref:CDGSH iron-sulfur domain-containing protein n=1 Tax=Streptomyces sp. NPDC091267 TaxID=3155195 RepID=UPI0034343B50